MPLGNLLLYFLALVICFERVFGIAIFEHFKGACECAFYFSSHIIHVESVFSVAPAKVFEAPGRVAYLIYTKQNGGRCYSLAVVVLVGSVPVFVCWIVARIGLSYFKTESHRVYIRKNAPQVVHVIAIFGVTEA